MLWHFPETCNTKYIHTHNTWAVSSLSYQDFDPIYNKHTDTCTGMNTIQGITQAAAKSALKYRLKCMFSIQVVLLLACVWRFNFLWGVIQKGGQTLPRKHFKKLYLCPKSCQTTSRKRYKKQYLREIFISIVCLLFTYTPCKEQWGNTCLATYN